MLGMYFSCKKGAELRIVTDVFMDRSGCAVVWAVCVKSAKLEQYYVNDIEYLFDTAGVMEDHYRLDEAFDSITNNTG